MINFLLTTNSEYNKSQKLITLWHELPSISADSESVFWTCCLRYDLAEDNNEQRRTERCIDSGEHVTENECGHWVHEHIAQQNGAKQEVAAFAQRVDLGCVGLLLWSAYTLQDVQLSEIERHETQIKPTEKTTERKQDDEENDTRPQRNNLFGSDYRHPVVVALMWIVPSSTEIIYLFRSVFTISYKICLVIKYNILQA